MGMNHKKTPIIFNEKQFLNGLKDHFLQKTVCSLHIFLPLQFFKYTSGLDIRVISLNLWCLFSLNSAGLCRKVKGLKTFSCFSWREKREPYRWTKSLYNVVSIHCLPCIVIWPTKTNIPGHSENVVFVTASLWSQVSWGDLQKALNKACRQFTLYLLVCIALTAMWVCRYSLPLKIYRKEETQMEVQIVTCLGIPAFELNSGRVLVQVTKKKSIFISWTL